MNSKLKIELNTIIDKIERDKSLSYYTKYSLIRELKKYAEYLNKENIYTFKNLNKEDIEKYLMSLNMKDERGIKHKKFSLLFALSKK